MVEPASDGSTARTSDGARMAILSNRLEAIARRMQNTLFRTGRSGVLNTAHDFSCVILTADCRLLSAAESLPIHVMIGPDIMAREVKAHHPELKRGDAFLHNSPYHGNSHAADHCTIVPVIDDEGVHRLTVLAKAHQADCGNSEPTTYMGHARDVYEEGALIFPAVKVQKDYKDIEDIIRMCRMRIRVPDQWWGDYLAAMGAARIGERELLKLGADVGWEALEQYVEHWFDYSEQRMIHAIGRLPSGTVSATSAHDPYPGVPDGIPTKVTLKVDAEAGRIQVDLRDNPDCQPCGLNLSEACSITAAMVGIFNGIKDHTVPPNAGSFRRVKVLLRENCATGIPRHPYSCSVATTNLADRISNPTQRALAELADGYGMAETGAIIPPTCGVISGRNPRRGNELYVNQLILGVTGGAGAPEADAWMTIVHVGNAGMCRQDSIEVDELSHPLHVSCRRLLADTEGAGTYRGAPSIEVEFGPAEDNSMRVLYVADGTINPAAGARGGGPGALIQVFKRGGNGEVTPLSAYGDVELGAGETIISISSGGGGYGPPEDRETKRVKHDLDEGWITRARAESVYGLVLDGAGGIDKAGTEERRREIRASPSEAIK